MGAACVRHHVASAPAGHKAEGKGNGSVKGGSVAGGSVQGKKKSGSASQAGATYRNQVLQKMKLDADNMGVTAVNASLGLDYIRMENKLLEKNIDRVLSTVGKDGRTVRCESCPALPLYLPNCYQAKYLLTLRIRDTIIGDNADVAEACLAGGGLLEDTGGEHDHRRRIFVRKRPAVKGRGAASGAAKICGIVCKARLTTPQHWRPHKFVLGTPMQEMTYMSGRTPALAFLSWKDVYSLCSRYSPMSSIAITNTTTTTTNNFAQLQNLHHHIIWSQRQS